MNLQKPLSLAVNRKSNARIVTDTFERAASILADYLKKITGGTFPIQSITDIFPNLILKQCENENPDGFCYYIYDKDIVFEAPNEQAAVYAVYDFLENICGCKYFTSTEEFIPFDGNLTVQFERQKANPVLAYREVYYRDYFDSGFAEKHKMTATSAKDNVWGFWCHSFSTLLPEDEYFEEHPEYFALYQGKRVGKNAQPCLSNPDVFHIIVKNLRKHIEDKPSCRFWSVSQNDNASYCTCEKCQEINEREGTPMGSLLDFVNRVADEFPDKTISTLAYWYSRKPPKTIRPRKNVHIMLCNIEANRGLPIETDERSKESKEELLAWGEICDNITLWDYCIQFRNLVSPFPNLKVIPENIRFFTNHKVKMLFSQANREYEGEFAALRGYLLAKCMWNPEVDAEAVIEDFCRGYYGSAASSILQYIKEITKTMEDAGGELSIFGGPLDYKDTWMSESHFYRYNELMEQALASVAGDAIVSYRVKSVAMPVWYSGIVLEYGSKEERMARIMKFASHARKQGLERVEEWKITPDQFVTDAIAALETL